MRVNQYISPYDYEEAMRDYPIKGSFIWWLLSLINFKGGDKDPYEYENNFKDYMRAAGGVVFFLSAPIFCIATPIIFATTMGRNISSIIGLSFGGFFAGIAACYLAAVLTAFVIAPILSPIGLKIYENALEHQYDESTLDGIIAKYTEKYQALAQPKAEEYLTYTLDMARITGFGQKPYEFGEETDGTTTNQYVQKSYRFKIGELYVEVDNTENKDYGSNIGVLKSKLERSAMAQAIATWVEADVKNAGEKYTVTANYYYLYTSDIILTITVTTKNLTYEAPIAWDSTVVPESEGGLKE